MSNVVKMRQLLMQDNHCDCGLFLLCSVQFFCHANPQRLTVDVLNSLNKANSALGPFHARGCLPNSLALLSWKHGLRQPACPPVSLPSPMQLRLPAWRSCAPS